MHVVIDLVWDVKLLIALRVSTQTTGPPLYLERNEQFNILDYHCPRLPGN